ncbi:hypothetical protein MUU77_03740 [Pseudoxanthomonas sp. F37]|uniref:hypothetical protein n=1 Tax=Pseudoxanthomonas sp. F37 TaxID=2932492 RepID=UPI001FD30E02|nr:hypothetical protein [Pseudoxanthomonas sp. F37]UOV09426.1 hypothetical protein MUU77_03740 [Pseudoxanthomonas sp. F37]
MMFMIGQGEQVVPVGAPEPQHCPRCDRMRDFEPQFANKYGRFDLLFGFVYGRRYQLACPVCHHGWRLDAREAERLYGRPDIPFRLRYGLVILLGVFAALGAASLAAPPTG